MPTLLCGDDDNYREVAEIIADRRGEPLHRDIDSVPAGRLIAVASPMDLSESDVLDLQRRLLRDGPEDGGFGIVTGRTPGAALSLYERSSPNRSRHCIVLRRENKTILSPDEETSVYNFDSATTDAVEEFVSDDPASLSMMIDGIDTHLHLSDGDIRGQPSDRRRDGDDADDLFADEIDVPHIFLNSCSSTIPGEQDEEPAANVGMGLLERTTSLIAGYRVSDGLSTENALYHALLRSGYDATEICYVLSKAAHSIDLEVYPYVVFGNPDARLSQTERSPATASVSSGEEIVIEATDVGSHVVEATIDDPRVADAENVILKNLVEEQRDWPLFYTAFQDGDETRVLVYSWGRVGADRLEFRVEGGREHPGVATVSASMRNAEQLNRLGLLNKKTRGQLTDLKNKATGLPEVRDERRHRANAYRDLESKVDLCLSSVENIEDRLVSYLENRSPGYFLDDYADRVVRRDADVADEACPYCGKPVFQKVMADVTGTTKRIQGNCPTCMNVYDVPVVHDEVIHPVVDVPEALTVGDAPTVEISFENPTETPIKAVFYPWLWSDDDQRGSPVYDPEVRRTTIEPSESYATTYEFDTSSLPPGRYAQYGIVIGNLNVYVTSRQLQLTEE